MDRCNKENQLRDSGDEMEECLTDYIATRWYRAPEVILGSNRYSYEADIWSVGCIYAEMVLGCPLFDGQSTFNQVELIVRGLDIDVKKEELSFAKSEISQLILHNLPSDSNPSITKKMKLLKHKCPDDGYEFLRKALTVDPKQESE